MSSLQRRFGLPNDLSPSVCHSVLLTVHLLSFIRAMCPDHFHIALVTYWTMPVTLVLCLMVVFQILSFSLTFRFFLCMARWLVSIIFTNAFVKAHAWHQYVTDGKIHWLKTFLFRTHGKVPVQKEFSALSRNTPSYFYSYRDFLPCSVFHYYCLSQIFIVSYFLCFCLFHFSVVCCVDICHTFCFSVMYLEITLQAAFIHGA